VSNLDCTDCLNTTEIEDIYLLNTGDIGTGVYDFGGATSFEIPNGTGGTTDATGELYLDSNGIDAGVTQGVLQSYDGSQAMYWFGVDTTPQSDNYIIKYDAGNNKLAWEVDAGAGGATAWDDITDPDNDGLTTIDFDNAAENTVFTTVYDAAGSFLKIDNSEATIANNVYLLDLEYTDDGNVNADFFKASDNNGDVKFTIQEEGNVFSTGKFTFGGAVAQNYNIIGDTTTNMGHSLASDDDLYIEGDLEVDGTAWFDAGITVTGSVYATAYYGDGSNLTGIVGGQWTDQGDYIYANNATDVIITDAGNVGVGTTNPDKKLEINSATGVNFRLTYNDSDGSATNYADFSMSSGGDLTINSSGGNVLLADGDTLAIGGSSAQSYNVIGDTTTNMGHSLASDDDLYIEGDLEVDGSAWFDGGSYCSRGSHCLYPLSL